jgi:hypothetical protein
VMLQNAAIMRFPYRETVALIENHTARRSAVRLVPLRPAPKMKLWAGVARSGSKGRSCARDTPRSTGLTDSTFFRTLAREARHCDRPIGHRILAQSDAESSAIAD